MARSKSTDREYQAWINMRQRCLNIDHPKYPSYGGRGITIDPSWDDFATFYKDMGPRPSKWHSLDRRDNDLGYSPDNCRWATIAEQAENKRRASTARLLIIDGRSLSVTEWSRVRKISRQTIVTRLHLGWTHQDAVFTPPGSRQRNDHLAPKPQGQRTYDHRRLRRALP